MTNETRFTPGPWFVGDIAHGARVGQWIEVGPSEERGDVACYVYSAQDAYLIAAAPEMYEALKEIEWIFEGKEDITDNGGPNDAMRACETVRAAIRKARGEQ